MQRRLRVALAHVHTHVFLSCKTKLCQEFCTKTTEPSLTNTKAYAICSTCGIIAAKTKIQLQRQCFLS